MKTTLTLLLLAACTLQFPAYAGPVPAHQIPGEAQWLIHLDVESFRHSTTGARLIQALVESRTMEFGDTVPVNFATVINGLDGITLFGTSIEMDGEDPMADGVAILRGSPQLIEVLQGAVAAAELEKPDAVRVIEESPRRVLLFPGCIHASIVSDRVVAISKSNENLQTFFATLDGEHPNAGESNLLETLDAAGEEFFFAAVAEGINTIPSLPPQARVLQMTEGVTVRVGENGPLLNLDISLRTDRDETAVQVRQVLQGVVALASLAQVEYPELQRVLTSIKLASEGRNVRLDLSYPVAEAERWIETIVDNLYVSFDVTVED